MAVVASYVKDAEKLAAQVRALGYECEAPDGHSFVVVKDGRLVASFPAHPSHAHWRGQSLSALRKAGIVIDDVRGGLKVEVTKEQSDALYQRVAPLVEDPNDRREFIEDAVRVLGLAHARGEHLDIPQFGASGTGKSSPEAVARESLRQLTSKQGTTKLNAYKRWSTLLDLVEKDRAAREVAEVAPGPPEVEVPAEPSDEVQALRDEAQAAERLMEEADARARAVEAKVEGLQKRADAAESNVRVLRDRVKQAEDAVEAAEKEARSARTSASRWESRARAAEDALDQSRPTGGFRDELGVYLLQLLGTTEYQESPPQWILDRVDKLAGLK